MRKNKTLLSKATSYREIGEYWDRNDLSDFWEKTRKVKVNVHIESEVTYFPVEKTLSEKLQLVAKRKGISCDVLVNLWLQEKLHEQPSH